MIYRIQDPRGKNYIPRRNAYSEDEIDWNEPIVGTKSKGGKQKKVEFSDSEEEEEYYSNLFCFIFRVIVEKKTRAPLKRATKKVAKVNSSNESEEEM